MQKSRKVWRKGLSFLMVLALAFTSVFFNITPIKAEVEPDKANSGIFLGMTLVDITGGGYSNKTASEYLELIKGEEYTLKVGLGYQDEDSPGIDRITKINKNSVYVYRNNIQKKSFGAFTTDPVFKTKNYVDVQFKAGEGSDIDSANGKAKDYIEVKGKTGGFGIDIYLSSYLVYNLKLKAEFYYKNDDGSERLAKTEKIDWNGKVSEQEAETILGKEFIGWYNKETDKKFDFNNPITDNVKLVAKYKDINNNEQEEEENKEEVTVTFNLDGKSESVLIKKGETFSKAKNDESTKFNDLKKQIEKEGWPETLLNKTFDAMKYDWYKESTFKNLADENEKIDVDKTYYGQLKKEKVNVTFYVNDTKQEIVTIEKGKTFTDAKGLLLKFNDFDNYDWFLDKECKENVDKNKAIDTTIIYYGKLKATDNNNNNNNNNGNGNDNNNNSNNNNNNDNNNNGNNNNNNDNNNNSNNNNNTTTPNTPSNDITIPEETTPLSPATTETSTTPATESKDNNDNIDIEDDDTALGTAVVDDKDTTLPAKKENKIIAKKESSLDITSEDTPLGTTLPKTGGSFGIIYILFGLILSAFGIKKFRER